MPSNYRVRELWLGWTKCRGIKLIYLVAVSENRFGIFTPPKSKLGKWIEKIKHFHEQIFENWVEIMFRDCYWTVSIKCEISNPSNLHIICADLGMLPLPVTVTMSLSYVSICFHWILFEFVFVSCCVDLFGVTIPSWKNLGVCKVIKTFQRHFRGRENHPTPNAAPVYHFPSMSSPGKARQRRAIIDGIRESITFGAEEGQCSLGVGCWVVVPTSRKSDLLDTEKIGQIFEGLVVNWFFVICAWVCSFVCLRDCVCSIICVFVDWFMRTQIFKHYNGTLLI